MVTSAFISPKAVAGALMGAGLVAAGPLLAVSATAQLRGGSGYSTYRRVSAVVAASWRWHQNYANGKSTTLLVLWRGSPQWLLKPGGGGGDGTHESDSMSSGGVSLTMEFDYDRNLVSLLGQELSLDKFNVVLSDDADAPGGSQIVGTRWIDPTLADRARPGEDPVATILQQTPELYDFLRCGTEVADPLMQRVATMFCDQMDR